MCDIFHIFQYFRDIFQVVSNEQNKANVVISFWPCRFSVHSCNSNQGSQQSKSNVADFLAIEKAVTY